MKSMFQSFCFLLNCDEIIDIEVKSYVLSFSVSGILNKYGNELNTLTPKLHC